MEEYKRKKKSDKAKRNKDLYGNYNSKKIRREETKLASRKSLKK
jgi:hypothetical protein